MENFLTAIYDAKSQAVTEMSALFTETMLKEGEILFDYNDATESFYFLQEGRLAVYKFTGFLNKMQVVALLDRGAVVGEGALLAGNSRKTRVTATEDCVLFKMSRQAFVRFQKEFPEYGALFLVYLLKIVSLRLEKTSERLARIL